MTSLLRSSFTRRAGALLACAALAVGCGNTDQGGNQAIILPDIFNGGGSADSAATDTSAAEADTATAGSEDTGSAGGEDTGGAGGDTAATGDTGSAGEDTAGAADTESGDDSAGADTASADTAAAEDTAGAADSAVEDTAGSGDTSQPADAANACVDADNDGYGVGCSKGSDCDDTNPNFNLVCPDCSKANHPGCPCKIAAANCYSGDPSWIGKGACIVGVQLCKSGFWGTCDGEVLPTPEACNGKDDNCNGLVDEGVLSSCGTCDMSCTKQEIGPDFGNPFDPGKDSSNGVGIDKNGYVVLDATKAAFDLNHIWIANSSEATISKLDTKTGWEVARYKACGNPSRTSVDLVGDVWVGCRAGGGVMKIAVKQTSCVDKNGNGKIDTSVDLDGNHVIGANEMLPLGQDECVIINVIPDAGEQIIRAAGVDKENHIWLGGWNTKRLFRLEPTAGNKVDQVQLSCNPYGLTIDQKGVVWAQCPSGGLVRMDPAVVPHTTQQFPYPSGAYGINVDAIGNLWVASGGNASRFDAITQQWGVIALGGSGGRGVATSADGYAYIAMDSSSAIAKINIVTLTKEATISLGSGRFPVGIAVDFDGYVWAVNQSKASASKVDPKAAQVIGEYPVGSGPYTYSDMTGYTLHNYTAPKGHYTHVFGFSSYSGTVAEAKSKTVWELVTADVVVPAKGFVKVRWRVGESLKALDTQPWSADYGPFPPATFPIDLTLEPKPVEGKFLQVEVFMQAGQDKISPILKSLQAKGKQIPVL